MAGPPARFDELVSRKNAWSILTPGLVQTINLSALSLPGIFSRPRVFFMWTYPEGSLNLLTSALDSSSIVCMQEKADEQCKLHFSD